MNDEEPADLADLDLLLPWQPSSPPAPAAPPPIPSRLPPPRPRYNSRRPYSALSTYRLMRGMTQAELAARAGISRRTVCAVEAGSCAPSVYAALAMAETLDVTLQELFKLRPGNGRPAAPSA